MRYPADRKEEEFMRRSYVVAIAGLLMLASTPGGAQQEPLRIFNGVWSFMLSGTIKESFVVFNVSNGARDARLPFGRALITVSDGRANANFRVSVVGVECFYLVSRAGRVLTWELKLGQDPCPQNVQL